MRMTSAGCVHHDFQTCHTEMLCAHRMQWIHNWRQSWT